MRTTYTWVTIVAVVTFATGGDVFLARAMQQIGDLGLIRQREGIFAVVGRVLRSGTFMVAIAFMTFAFFSHIIGLSWANVSLFAPASASLTFIANTLSAKWFLHEHVDRRRWIAVTLVAAGVALLAQ